MKKKVLAISAVLAIAAIVLSAGTLAYFSDKDSKTNTFTLGKVDITLTEKNHDGTAYVDGAKLMPGSNINGAVPKEAVVTVESDSEDAWVWVEILIPSELYNSKDENHESNNALHFNQFMNFLDSYNTNSSVANSLGVTDTFTEDLHQWSIAKYIDEVTVNNKTYARLRTTHKDIVTSGSTTSPAISQVYMDNDVKYEDGKVYIPADGASSATPTDFVEYTGDWEVIVNAYGVQASGIDDVNAAVKAYYNL